MREATRLYCIYNCYFELVNSFMNNKNIPTSALVPKSPLGLSSDLSYTQVYVHT